MTAETPQNPPARLLSRPLLVGEILFDCFPDGHQVLGGAPFNAACHLAAFGQDPLLISRLGEDENGELVRKKMLDLGVSTEAMQTDSERPTGRVEVSLEQGTPSFDIQPDQAFDFLEAERALAVAREQPLAIFYHGTLTARSAAGRETIDRLSRELATPRFVDVNLRDPWWTAKSARALAWGANWLKLNEPELERLSRNAEPKRDGNASEVQSEVRVVDDVKAIAALRSDLEVENVLVTAADRGGRILSAGDPELNLRLEAPPVPRLEDTVGAGDALASVMMLGLLRGWATELAFRRGLHFASAICGIRGAVPEDQDFYEPFLAEWRIDGR